MGADRAEQAVAIVGMSGRFPGARNLNEYWQLLRRGREAAVTLSSAELLAAGVPEALLHDQRYVKVCMRLDDVDLFDAPFFGYSPQQAARIDPQQRVFLECAWEALEHAGYCAETYQGSIGVFAGAGTSTYLLESARLILEGKVDDDLFQLLIDAEKDYLTTRVSYKLGLRGPSLAIQTACSSSLVAVHVAAQNLLNYECDMALAGGVFARHLAETGYLYSEGGIASSDGHCRAYDANATGIVPGGGVGLVVLRRLKDALAGGDHIHAVILGSAVNNDGARKVGYTAPGLNAQKEVIATALAVAEVSPSDVGMIEGHGTGTSLGDAIELTALTEIFASRTAAQKFCALGSVKTNIGHLDAAAGVAGLLKAVLCLENKALVPSLNYSTPHAMLATPESPFYVNTSYRDWSVPLGGPRIAGVSSFGIGGTNAHVVLAESPLSQAAAHSSPGPHLFVISGHTSSALSAQERSLSTFLRERPNENLADVAYTLQVGRKAFAYRRCWVADSHAELLAALAVPAAASPAPVGVSDAGLGIAFLFPGQGVSTCGVLADLYRDDPALRADFDECVGLFSRHLPCAGLADLVSPSAGSPASRDPVAVQPSLFIAEYCLSHALIRMGLRPTAVLGHSLGEYAAACVCGALSLEAVVGLVAARASLIAALPAGRMVAVRMPEESLRGILPPEVDLAAINTSSQCVVSGAAAAIDVFVRQLREQGVDHRELEVTHAFHSAMMDPALGPLRRAAQSVQPADPAIAWVLATNGSWVSANTRPNAAYWTRHLREPVRFCDGLRLLADAGIGALVEVGPGRTLTHFAGQELRGAAILAEAPIPEKGVCSQADLLGTLGKLWTQGAAIDWQSLSTGKPRRRVVLPTYPFERVRHRLSARDERTTQPISPSRVGLREPRERWFYLPSWRTSFDRPSVDGSRVGAGMWVVLGADLPLGELLVHRLREAGAIIVSVARSQSFRQVDQLVFEIDPLRVEHYRRLFESLEKPGEGTHRFVNLWACDTAVEPQGMRAANAIRDVYLGVLASLQALHAAGVAGNSSLCVIASRSQQLAGDPPPDPEKAPLLAICKVAAQEVPGLRCCLVDLSATNLEPRRLATSAEWVLAETLSDLHDPVVAYRGLSRFVQTYEAAPLALSGPPTRELRRQGVYVITGGLGRIGLALAEHLARVYAARVVLVSRRGLPERSEVGTESLRQKLVELEAAGGQVVVVQADVADAEALARIFSDTESRFGLIRGVFHLAADIRSSSSRKSVLQLTPEDFATQLHPKVGGFHALRRALGVRRPDFVVNFSSTSAVLGGLGFAAYAAANASLDSATGLAIEEGFRWMSINWDAWIERPENGDDYSLRLEEGFAALSAVIQFGSASQVVVSATALQPRVETWLKQRARAPTVFREIGPEVARANRVMPRSPLEQTVATVWQEALGLDCLGIDEEFLALGGDSLLALRVVSRLREVFGVTIPMRLMVSSTTTVRKLAVEIVASALQSAGPAAVERQIEDVERTGAT